MQVFILTEWLRLAVSTDFFSELSAVGTVRVQSSVTVAVFYQSHLLKLL